MDVFSWYADSAPVTGLLLDMAVALYFAALLVAALIAFQSATGPRPIVLTRQVRPLRVRVHHRLAVTVHELVVRAAAQGGPPTLRPPSRFSRRFRRDPLSKYRAVTGVKARIRWWERLRGLVGLGMMIVIIGAGIALMVVLFLAGVRVALEIITE